MKRIWVIILCLMFSISLKPAVDTGCTGKVKAIAASLYLKKFTYPKRGEEVIAIAANVVSSLEKCGLTPGDLKPFKKFQKDVNREVKERMKTREVLSSKFYAKRFLELITAVEKKYAGKKPGNNTRSGKSGNEQQKLAQQPPAGTPGQETNKTGAGKKDEKKPKKKLVIDNDTLKKMEEEEKKAMKKEEEQTPVQGQEGEEEQEEEPKKIVIAKKQGFPNIDTFFPTGEDLITPEGSMPKEEAFPILAGLLKKKIESMEKQLEHLNGTVHFLHLGFILSIVVLFVAAAILVFIFLLFRKSHRKIKDLDYQILRLKRENYQYNDYTGSFTKTGRNK